MRRYLFQAVFLLALVPALVGVARAGEPAPVVAAPTFEAAREEAVDARAYRFRLWLEENPVEVPLTFEWPADGEITSVYGNDAGRPHAGIDIGTLRSLAITASAPGRVTQAGYVPGYEGYGKIVLVRSGPYKVLYSHLSEVTAREGELVRQGDRLGDAGCTGICTGTHLHFEIRKGEKTVDPMRLLAEAS